MTISSPFPTEVPGVHQPGMATKDERPGAGQASDEPAPDVTATSAPAAEPDELDESEVATPASVRVLVVDDEPEILQLVGPVLQREGYEVYEADNGDDALQAIEGLRPQIVVLDVMMPGMSGWEVCRYVRSHPDLEGVRILMATGIGEQTNAATSPLYGADDYIDKPFRLDELVRRVDELVERIRTGAL